MRRCLSNLGVAISFIVVVASAAGQDGLKGLKDYLKQYKYATFVPPRENVVVSTIVNYDSGFETIVSSKCVPAAKVKPTEPSSVGLTTRSGTLSKNVGIEGSFAQAIEPKINVQGAYSDSRVQTIGIEISDPKETHIESNDLKEYISTLTAGPCLEAMSNKHNRIIAGLLEVDSIKYTFQDKDGKKISLDAQLRAALKLSPKYARDFENKDSLQITKPLFIGYRAWRVTRIPGAVRDRIEIEEATPEELSQLKLTNKQQR